MNVFEIFGTIGLRDNGFNDGIDKAESKGSGFASKVGGALVSFGKVAAIGLGAAATAMTGLAIQALKAGGDLEQSLGGITTLFGTSADTVIKNAEEAYRTAGLSANTYMEQATSFAASLIASTGGDAAKAAGVADMAIIDMADKQKIVRLKRIELYQRCMA